MEFLVVLPIIFIAFALYQVLDFTKSKFWIKIVKFILIIAIIIFVIEYIRFMGFDFTQIFKK